MTQRDNIKEEIGLPKGFYWTPVPKALSILKSCIDPIKREKRVRTFDSIGYILSRDVVAQRSSPPLSNSAVDGVAFRFPKNGESRIIKIIPSTVIPGRFPDVKISKGEGIKILTGGPVPSGADTVILKEDILEDDLTFEIPPKMKKGENTRPEGEDKKAGTLLFSKGHKLKAQDLALLTSVGVLDVNVFERLNIGILSTGDELVDYNKKAKNFQIYDSNRPMIITKLESWGYNTCDLGIIRDCQDDLESKIRSSKGHLDLIVTTGGASAGDRDMVSKLLNSDGDLVLWRVAIKPGRPFAMGFMEGIPIYALPGNPVAAFVCALIFLKPSLDSLSGGSFSDPKFFNLKSNFSKTKKKGRREFLRARVDKKGTVEIFKSEGSGRVSSLSWSQGLVELGEEITDVKVGSIVKFLPYDFF